VGGERTKHPFLEPRKVGLTLQKIASAIFKGLADEDPIIEADI
jgi:hypothetical protein